jgi:hypothetical protein
MTAPDLPEVAPVSARINPVVYAVLLPTLLAAHTVADHVIQTDHQAATKATAWRGMAGHVGGYQATQAGAVAAICALTGVRLSWRHALAGWLLSGVTHAILDRRWPVRLILRSTRSPVFADMTTPLHGQYLADQALHTGCLAVAAALMSRRAVSR